MPADRYAITVACAGALSLPIGCRPAATEPIDSPPAKRERPRSDGEAPTVAPAATTGAAPCTSAAFPGPRQHEREAVHVAPAGKPAKIGALACRTDREVWRDEQERLRVCTIARRGRAHGLELAGDNYTHFHANGRPYQTDLAREHELPVTDGTTVACAAEHAVLRDDGRVEHCMLARDQAFARAKCARGGRIGFRASGELWHCVLAAPLDALDVTFPAGTRVGWHEGGGLESASIATQMHVRGWLVRSEVEVHESGELAKITLAEPRRIGGVDVPELAEVWFYPNGRPWHVEYTADMGTMIHGELWTDTRKITWDCAENVTFDDTERYQSDVRPHPPKGH